MYRFRHLYHHSTSLSRLFCTMIFHNTVILTLVKSIFPFSTSVKMVLHIHCNFFFSFLHCKCEKLFHDDIQTFVLLTLHTKVFIWKTQIIILLFSPREIPTKLYNDLTLFVGFRYCFVKIGNVVRKFFTISTTLSIVEPL